jgi:hypothetical protein
MFADRVAGYDDALPGWAKSWQALTEAIGGIVCPPRVSAKSWLGGDLAGLRHADVSW